MTEYWVSKAKFWCKFCKVWMTDNKASRAKHDNGKGHKEAVQNFFKETREKKRAEAREKAEIENEMREIERKARRQFATDVEAGQAKFTAFHPQFGGPPGHFGGPPGPPGAPPPPPGERPGFPPGAGPPPPPPRAGESWQAGVPPPPPPRPQQSAEDRALAAELAKEGIILNQDEGAEAEEAEAPVEVVYGGHDIFWEYKPAKEVQAEDSKAENEVKVENEVKSEDEARPAKRSKWDIKPVEDGTGIKQEDDVQKEEQEAEIKKEDPSSEEEQVFGPYTGSEMASWASQGYFSQGGGAYVRQVSADGEQKLTEFVATLGKEPDELINLLTGIEGGGVEIVGGAEAAEAQEDPEAGEKQQEAGVIGKWETVRIVNTAVEKQRNNLHIKLMESTQKRLFEKKDDSDDEEHTIFSGVHDSKERESAFAEPAAADEPDPEPVAKPGAVVFKSGGGKARNRSFRKKGGDD